MNDSDSILLILGRLEGKVDALVSAVGVHEENVEKLEERVRILENARAKVIGISAGLASVISMVAFAIEVLVK